MKIVPDTYFIISLGMSLLLHVTFPIVKLIPYPYSLLGIVLIITGLVLVFVTNFILLKKKTSIKALETPNIFVTSGPFKFSRNPIYLGMAVILLGTAIFLGSLSPFIFPIIFVISMNILFIPKEEHTLEKIFREKYLAYKIKVRRWL